jgi:hypothetical protein
MTTRHVRWVWTGGQGTVKPRRRCQRAEGGAGVGIRLGREAGRLPTATARRDLLADRHERDFQGVAQLPAGIPHVLPSFIVSQRVAERHNARQLIGSPPD